MNYFIFREGQQYGPYTLADLQRYVASGEVSMTDLATSEGMSTPTTVSQIIGNIAAPVAYPASVAIPAVTAYPAPPNLHWGLVLLFAVLSCGIFTLVWEVIQASWVKKIDSSTKAFPIYLGAAALLVLVFFASFFSTAAHTTTPFTGLIQIAYYVTVLIARFQLKSALEQHFNTAEPMGLSLSGVMTFFFGGIYFQYHINDIVRRKMLDQMYGGR